MAIPTFSTAAVITATVNGSTHTVDLPQSGDGLSTGDTIAVMCGRDQSSGTPAGPTTPDYASGGWTVDDEAEQSGDAEVIVFSCVVTDASEVPASDVFTTGGNRKTRWYARGINGADYANREVSGGKVGVGNLDIDGITTTNDDNLVMACVSAQQGTKNASGTIDSPGSWTVQDEGIADSGAGPDGGLSVLSITQATAGAIPDETDLESGGGFDGWAAATIAFPGVAAAAAPVLRRRQRTTVRL